MGQDDDRDDIPLLKAIVSLGGMGIWGGVGRFSGRREMKLLGNVILRDERKYGDDGLNS